ncbi:MAG: lipopolysaccharide heptosyltransferase II [Lentisphaeria bacterium]
MIEPMDVNQGEMLPRGTPGTGPQFTLYTPKLERPGAAPAVLIPRESGFQWHGGAVVRSTNWLGDTLMALPALHQFRQLLPAGARLAALSTRGLEAVWRMVPWIDEVIVFDGARVTDAAAEAVRRFQPGVGLVLPNSFGGAYDLFNLGIPVRVGRRGRWRKLLLTHTLRESRHTMHPGRRHQLSDLLELVSLFGEISWSAECPPLVAGDPAATLAKFGLAPAATPLLVLGSGAAYGVGKQWSPANFRAVAARWCERGGRAVAVGSRKEVAAGAEAVRDLPGGLNLAGQTSLVELAHLLGAARAVVCNDSGVMHLAAALGRPGVALFGCTDPVSTGPLQGRWTVLMEKLECAPCFKRTCQLTGADCLGLRQIPPTLVLEALDFVLGGMS